MPRLFFALSLPASLSDALDDLAEGIPDARWALENDYHLTLAFLGEVPPGRRRDAEDAARRVRVAPLEIQLRGVGAFPRRPPARVLWAGIDPEPRLLTLQRRLCAELRADGFLLEQRRFHPHVTLARLDRDVPRGPVSDWLVAHMSFGPRSFRVTRFQLLESEASSGAPRYRLLQSFGLFG